MTTTAKSRYALYAPKVFILGALCAVEVVAAFMVARYGLQVIDRPAYLFIAVLGLASAALAIYRIEYGILLAVLAVLLVSASLPTGTQSRIPAAAIVVGLVLAIWLVKLLISGFTNWNSTEFGLQLAGFLCVLAFSMLWGIAFRSLDVAVPQEFLRTQIGALGIFALLVLWFLFISRLGLSVSFVRWLVFTLVGLGGVAILLDTPPFNFGVANISGLIPMWVAAVALGQVLFNRGLARWQSGLLIAIVFVWVYRFLVLGTTWLAGWLPGLLVLLLLIFSRSKVLGVLVIAVLFVQVVVNFDFYHDRVWLYSLEEDGNRIDAWQRNWEITKEHLAFGTGPAGYAAYYGAYFPDESMATHNNYLDIFSQGGIFALGFLAWFMLRFLAFGLNTSSTTTEGTFESGLARSITFGFLGVALAMLLGDWLLPFVYTGGLSGFSQALVTWTFLALLPAVKQMTDRRVPT